MAAPKKPAAKGKGGKPTKPAYKFAKVYDISGGAIKRKTKSCPKCGQGIFMAKHQGRSTCGKCGYMERT
ncbi:MAG: 30S ribosomal protein S27ae [Nanoarchaeota archaeon]